MEESSGVECFADLQDLTIKIQNCFSSVDSDDNVKWSILKDYHSKFLLKKYFNKNVAVSYVSILSSLLDWLQSNLHIQMWQETVFDDVFLNGIPHEAFLILIERLGKSENFAQQKIINLILKFIQGSSLEAMFIYQCISQKDWDLKYVSKSKFWDDLITATVSLPERIANQTKGKFVKFFSPSSYVPRLLNSIFKVLHEIHYQVRNSQDCSVEFLAKLTGRLCIIENGEIVAKMFSKELIKVCESDFIWRRISQNFITKMPSNSLDSFIINLLLTIPWYGFVEWILGDEGVKNPKIKYIMTDKLLFHRPFKQDIILQNIIGYFTNSSDRVCHFKSIMNSLLDSWMDEITLRHQSIEQKIYIASALMVCAGWMRQLTLDFEKNDYINKILKGTQIRLESSDEMVRSLGMIVGEHLIKSIDPDSPPLKFEFSDTVVFNHLKNLLNIPSRPLDDSIFIEDLKCFEEVEIEKMKENDSSKNVNSHVPEEKEELDSDDDLEPYDLSNDILKEGTKRPFYIRECMMGLAEQQNAEWTEQCMKHAEELIKANAFATEEVAEEMTKIVFHLDDNFAIPNFAVLRHQILIALTMQCPIMVSSYLTSQFSEKDYTIRQRLDVLEVLAASSALLTSSHQSVSSTSNKEYNIKREADWMVIVNQRLKAKTKCFTKTSQPVLLENKFSSIAGNFFFPLLNSYERLSKVLKLNEVDSYVLGRFIYTLGLIMCSASNSLHCRQMAINLLQFLLTVKSHKDSYVCQSIIFAVAASYMGVPSSILFTDILTEVTQINKWLQYVVQNNPEGDCVEKALYTLSIFQSAATEVSLLPTNLKGLTFFE